MDEQQPAEQSASPFDARHYWEERLRAHPDITGVGYLGLSPRFIEVQYHARREQIEKALRQYHLSNLSGRSVLDVGSGTGIWLDFWRRHGPDRLVGLDFAQPSVDRLRKQFPDLTIVQADLSVIPLPLPEESRFDVISAIDVLLHIVDPEGFQRAIANLAQHCAPGGLFIISDPIVQGKGYVPPRSSTYDKVRTLATYQEVLEANGFTIESVRPSNILVNTPLEASSYRAFRAWKFLWRVTCRWGRSNALSTWLGPGMRVVERAARIFYPGASGPSAKMIFARKRG
jgi:SAM-dependent methyltransferase